MLLDAALAGLNRLLAREEWPRERLQPFAGQSVRLVLGGTSLRLAISAAGDFSRGVRDGRSGHDEARDSADVTLTVPTERLLPQLLEEGPAALVAGVHIDGSAALAEALREVFRDLRLDPEAVLAERIGDIAAHRLSAIGRQALRSAAEGGRRLRENVGEFVRFEADRQVAPEAMQAFAQQVRDTADRTETLEAQIDALAAQAGRHPTH